MIGTDNNAQTYQSPRDHVTACPHEIGRPDFKLER